MNKVYQVIAGIWSRLQGYQSRRKKEKMLSAGSFRDLCLEVKDAAELSSRLWTGDDWFQQRVAQIDMEIKKLDSLLDRREFDRIPLEKKDELRRHLIQSREELLKRVHAAPCPTDRVQ